MCFCLQPAFLPLCCSSPGQQLLASLLQEEATTPAALSAAAAVAGVVAAAAGTPCAQLPRKQLHVFDCLWALSGHAEEVPSPCQSAMLLLVGVTAVCCLF